MRYVHPSVSLHRSGGLPAFLTTLLAAAGPWTASAAPSAPADEVPAAQRLSAPASGAIRVAFLVSPGANVMDFAGPWEVFQDVHVPGRGQSRADDRPFSLFTVAETRTPFRLTGGLRIVPDYTFEDAPRPGVIVVPAQGTTPALLGWLREASETAELTMSVCTGAWVLAGAGLLDGKAATTHHEAVGRFSRQFPKIEALSGVRYVEGPRIATAAGLTSGIDLSLRVVARYFGTRVAERTAKYLEHESDGWRAGRGVWRTRATPGRETPKTPPAVLQNLDAVHLSKGRKVPGRPSIALEHEGYRYVFASHETRETFHRSPNRYGIQLEGACAYMAKSGAPAKSGDPDRYLVHGGRIYIFASENCRDSFRTDPARYLE